MGPCFIRSWKEQEPMFENLNLKTKCALILISHGICLFIGRQLTPKEILTKHEKVIDQEATRLAISQAIEKLKTEYKQVRTKKTLKKPDGTLQITEKTETQKDSLKESIADTREAETQKVHEVEKILAQAPQKNFSLELATGIKSELPSLNSLPTFSIPDLNAFAKAQVSYRIDGDFWAFLGYEHQILNKKNYGGFGVSYILEF